MRVAIAGLVVVVALLGALQVLGSIAARRSAQPGSWVGFVPAGLARRVDGLDTSLPLPEALRLVLARGALSRGDVALAARDVSRLGPSRDRLVLEGRLAQAQHEPARAEADFLAADDVADVEQAADARAARGDLAGALALEQSAIRRLQTERTQEDALAEAYLHAGRLQQAQAYRFGLDTPAGRASELAAADSYARAVALAPFSLRYLIALGNQQLNLARIDAAERTFTRARDIDPESAEPLAGLADAALRSGDRARARAYVARARELDPASSAVLRLVPRLGD